jgi:hypothetical protein
LYLDNREPPDRAAKKATIHVETAIL